MSHNSRHFRQWLSHFGCHTPADIGQVATANHFGHFGETLRWSTFGVANDQVVQDKLLRIDYGGKLRFAGQFAHGQWPKLAVLDLDSWYSSCLVSW